MARKFKTGYTVRSGATAQDIGERYINKEYLLEVYPSIVPGKTTPGLWAWGNNNYGQLGTGDTASRSSPVQVGTLTNWRSVSCGSTHTVAIKTDGTLWAWGANSNGELGTGDTASRSSPVQVGTSNNWISVACGEYHTTALAFSDV